MQRCTEQAKKENNCFHHSPTTFSPAAVCNRKRGFGVAFQGAFHTTNPEADRWFWADLTDNLKILG
jgi:hypothetical protein